MEVDQLYRSLVSTGDLTLDVGANIGQTARVLSRLVGPTGRCICFEPEPQTFRKLAMMAAQSEFSNVEPYCCALADHIGHDLLYFGRDPGVAQASTIVRDLANVERLGRNVSSVKIQTDMLDNFCVTRDVRPNFIKIDVEGAENRVFAGARNLLTATRPPIVFEFGYGFSHGAIPDHFILLQHLGYILFIVDIMFKQGRPAVLTGYEDCLIEISLDQLATQGLSGNLLAIPSLKVDSIHRLRTSTFDSAQSNIVPYTPTNGQRIRAKLASAETGFLGFLETTYRGVRSYSISGVRRLLKYKHPSS